MLPAFHGRGIGVTSRGLLLRVAVVAGPAPSTLKSRPSAPRSCGLGAQRALLVPGLTLVILTTNAPSHQRAMRFTQC